MQKILSTNAVQSVKKFFSNPCVLTLCLALVVVGIMASLDPAFAGNLDSAFEPVTTAKDDIMDVIKNIIGPAVIVLSVALGGILLVFRREWIKFAFYGLICGVVIAIAPNVGTWVTDLF